MASIIVVSGAKKGNFYPLGHRTNVIGRSESLLVQVLDKHVSRRHMQIRFDAGKQRYYAFDMNSKHGVFINGRRITTETLLVDGDQILIGETTLLFTNEDFPDRKSALSHFKKVGERIRPTAIQ